MRFVYILAFAIVALWVAWDATLRTPAFNKASSHSNLRTPTAATSLSVRLQPSPSPSPSLETSFKNHFPGEWNFERNEQGSLFSIHGAEIPKAGKDPQSALSLARKISPLLGVPPEQISSEGVRIESSPRSTSFDFFQSVGGYSVFDGQIRLLANKADGTIYMINTELRPVKGEFERKILFSADEARSLIQENFGNKNLLKTDLRSSQPVLWADETLAELAWSFIIKLGGRSPDRREILISTQRPLILFERSLMIKD